MFCQIACRWIRVVAVMLVAASVALSAAAAEERASNDPSELEAVRLLLDRIEVTLRREGLSVQALYDLGQTLSPARDNLRDRIAELEPQFAQVEARLKQLGPPPAKDAPAESPTLAEERTRLNKEYSEIEGPLKQTKLLASRADQLADQITERRRAAYARQLFEQTPSVISPSLWLDSANALGRELSDLSRLLRAWFDQMRAPENWSHVAAAVATLLLLGLLMMLLRHWLKRWAATVPGAPTRFGKALAALGVILRIMLVTPLLTVATIAVLENFRLLPERLIEIAYALGAAVVIAVCGRAVATGVLAPGAPERRLIALNDASVQVLMRALVWSARAMGLLVFSLVVHKVLAPAPVLLITTNMTFALVVCALLAQLLWSSYRPGSEEESEALPRALWIRTIGWLTLTVMVIALLAGYSGFATFIAERMLSTLAVLGVLYLLIIFTHTLFIDRLGAGTARGRVIATNFGVSPKRLGLIASLISGGICLLLIFGALILIIGPWEVSAGDFLDTIKSYAFGLRIGEVTISFGAILAAAFWLLLALLVTKALQKWLERYLLPRTELEPSLQQSIAAIIGYIGVIVAIVLALTQLGIDLQKVALIAGALSVGIGFGLQSIVSNFVSGLILLAERPIRIGDLVVVKGEEGYVRRIRVRATEIETFERASVIVPNAEFITSAVKNWTHANTTGRIIVKVALSYDCDPDLVCATLLASAGEHPRVLKQPPPRALLIAFGTTALEFELRAFVGHVDDGLLTKSDLHLDILRRFRAAGITMASPPPQIVLQAPAASGKA